MLIFHINIVNWSIKFEIQNFNMKNDFTMFQDDASL